MNSLQQLDYVVFLLYLILVASYGYWVFQRDKTKNTTTQGFFLAEGSLTWWAIGASLIASNISAEHFIGMSGSGFAIGLAISSYEWMSAATLIIVAVFFIPIYLKNKIYTMPQLLSLRYNDTVATIMAVFWLLLYVFINLTSILYLGSLALETITGVRFEYCMGALSIFAILITLGGMKVIGYTDVIQVVVLILGGLATTYLALNMVSDKFGGEGIFDGLSLLKTKADDHFHMIFSKGDKHYYELPGLSILIGGMWINNLNYWGCNQYIVQRALGADLKTARSGIIFAAFLKLLIPLICVIPGIAAYVLYNNGSLQQEMVDLHGVVKPDHAYPSLMNLLPQGLKGLAFAALTAAIVASLASKCNSIATIFSLDIYKKILNKNATERQTVLIGRYAVWVSFAIALIVTPQLRHLEQAYQFIQEYSNYITPGAFALFSLGLFWKKTTSNAAIIAAVLTLPLSLLFKILPDWMHTDPIPFLDRTLWVYLILVILMITISLIEDRKKKETKGFEVDTSMFKVSSSFVVISMLICGVLAALYTVFW
ncbi:MULTISPECIES: sodium/sugar symporter [unclassified Arcicella]|uniref:sodium/sugar symporter n=1 Tax=unclassified Arcicella TaxID=2644986 RepID=UPI0028584ED4|nr:MULTISPECIES: sodium/sugar symporter [unclassified Arcicella]MDR6561214.1 SSS family solute:Na+ symporter [Arcicella sp. BE51]MDR6811098.1 SSS family solute:Na+ symporter [Arcicella sp. BE140]MDR6822448.1 SSS family solute:Na+ symporter [Arcicella sp. BE139]